MQEKKIRSAHGETHYWIAGREHARRRWMVFLHGLTADHTLFERQIEYFSKTRAVLAWDAPAHGASRPYADFSYAAAAQELADILKAEGIEKPVLVGQSMGGYVSQAYLKRFPDAAAAFIGIDTCPFGEGYYSRSDKWWLRQVGWMARLYPHGFLVDSVAGSCTETAYARENMRAALSPYGKDELCRLMGIGFAGFLEENADMQIDCPVLLLVGEHDRTGKVRQYCAAWHEKTGYPLVVIPGAAHNANADNPQAVNSAIEEFCTEQGV